MELPLEPRKYLPVGYCIYCGSAEPPISDEHILPLGFQPKGMNWLLPKSCCERCRKLTHKFESPCIRDMFGPLRYRLDMKSRTRGRTTAPIKVVLEDGTVEVREVLLDRLPLVCPGFDWPTPSILDGTSPSVVFGGEHVVGFSPMEIRKLFPGAAGLKIDVYILPFAKMLAKIAHAYIIAEYREIEFAAFLPAFIRGAAELGPLLVGGDHSPDHQSDDHLLHHVFRQDVRQGDTTYVGVSIRLFARLSGPRYHVVVGKLL